MNPELSGKHVRSLGQEVMSHIKDSFLNEHDQSWIMIMPTVHQMFGHSWEMFEWNGGKSIAKWSKNPLECWNKHVRSFQSRPCAWARQISVKKDP